MPPTRGAAMRWTRRLALLVAVIAVTLLVGRIVQSELGPPLEPWHTFIPDEPHAAQLDHLDWNGYLAAEARAFAAVRAEVTDRLDEQDRTPDDRYFAGSPVYPGHFAQDWNRSYVLEPDGPAEGRGCPAARIDRRTIRPTTYRTAVSRASVTWRSGCARPATAPCLAR